MIYMCWQDHFEAEEMLSMLVEEDEALLPSTLLRIPSQPPTRRPLLVL